MAQTYNPISQQELLPGKRYGVQMTVTPPGGSPIPFNFINIKDISEEDDTNIGDEMVMNFDKDQSVARTNSASSFGFSFTLWAFNYNEALKQLGVPSFSQIKGDVTVTISYITDSNPNPSGKIYQGVKFSGSSFSVSSEDTNSYVKISGKGFCTLI